VNIEKLEGVKNYGTWKFEMKLLLIDSGLWDCIESTEQLDQARDLRAYAKICLHVQSVCHPHVRNAKCAKEAWHNLKAAYENRGISRRLLLKKKLSRIRYEDFASMNNYLSEIISLTQELVEVGCHIDDEEVAELMLVGLPDEFNPLVMAIEGTQVKLTSEFVKSRLLQSDYRKTDAVDNPPRDSAFAVGKGRSTYVPVCHHCHKEGHTKPRCPELKL
jgi:hypothetical protein